MPLRVETIPVPTDPAEPHPWLADAVKVEAAHHIEMLGHDDLSDSLGSVAHAYTFQESTAKVRLIALDGDAVVGAAHLQMPQRDNLSLAYFFPNYLPGANEGDVYDTLWASALGVFDEGGRTLVHSWATHPLPEPGREAMTPISGSGSLGADVRARWLVEQGFVLQQVERYSVLDVDDSASSRAATIVGEHPTTSGVSAYRVQSWTGATPPALVQGMARLRSRMSVDTPQGGMDYEEESWDADEVRRRDERMAAAGRELISTVAVTRDGVPVAYTDITAPRATPWVAFQDDTLVHGEHRGHRLGALVKATNTLALREHLPHVERVHTWNAEENTHMLAINEELGFRGVGVQGGWQLRLPVG